MQKVVKQVLKEIRYVYLDPTPPPPLVAPPCPWLGLSRLDDEDSFTGIAGIEGLGLGGEWTVLLSGGPFEAPCENAGEVVRPLQSSTCRVLPLITGVDGTVSRPKIRRAHTTFRHFAECLADG